MSDLSSRTIAQLKEELQQKGVDVKGLKLKKDYIEKLQEVLSADPEAEVDELADSGDAGQPEDVADPSSTAINEEQGKHISSVEHAEAIQDPETTLPADTTSDVPPVETDTQDIEEAKADSSTAITKEEKDEQILGDADGDLGEKMEAAAKAGEEERREEESSAPDASEPVKQAAEDAKEEGNVAVAAAEALPPPVVAEVDQQSARDEDKEDVKMDQESPIAQKRKRADEDDEQDGKRARLSPSAHEESSKPQSEQGTAEQSQTANEATHPLPENLSHVSHPATRALYISNLKRPLLTPDLKAWLIEQGVSDGVTEEEVLDGEAGVPTGVWLDGVKSHCYCIFKNIDIAIAAAAKIQGQVFPADHGAALTVEFLPEDKVPSLVEQEKAAWENGRNKLVLEINKGMGFAGGSDYSFELVPPKGSGSLGDLRPPRATPASRPPELGGPSTFGNGVRPEFRPPPPNNGWGARANVGAAAPGFQNNTSQGVQRTRTQPSLSYQESPKHAGTAPRFDRGPQQQRDSGGWGQRNSGSWGQRDSGSWGSQPRNDTPKGDWGRNDAPKGDWGRSNDSDNGWGRPAQTTQGGW